ncbi:glycosyltransferase family 2 protein [Pedobacter glucosidilyticus]|jgi:glycosyltransferase involved in cell wall biosynthesis|uniref:glycosyltransferase family 2 protein n=1 Tax=Pedobacter glucosidilyticus TaxID=1122941 RepID=UPI0026ED0110|nr:glycosyltransferase [Pedobacter glucosidilyticus]
MLSGHNNEKILVSVIIPCYNAEDFVYEAVSSIINQTYQTLQIIVIDDCSTDKTGEILKSLQLKDDRILYIKNETNLKLVECLNIGIRLSKGKYIARMDADDISSTDRIAKQVSFLELNSEIGLLGSYIEVISSSKDSRNIMKLPVCDSEIRAYLFVGSPFFHPTVMIRKSVLIENNCFYNSIFYRSEDYKMWIDILDKTKGANLPEVLLKYRILESSETRLAEKNLIERRKIASKIHKDFLNKFNINLNETEQLIYTCSMNRAQLPYVTNIIGKNPSILINIFEKIINSLTSETKLDVDKLKSYFGERVIVFIIYSKAYLTCNGILKLFSKYTFLGFRNILKDKFNVNY